MNILHGGLVKSAILLMMKYIINYFLIGSFFSIVVSENFALAQAPYIQWEHCFGGYYEDGAFCIQQTTDGGFIVAGASRSSDGDVTGHHKGIEINLGWDSTSDYWIVKLDAKGAMQWEKSLGGSGEDEAYSIQQTKEGGYIVAGYSNSKDGDVTGIHKGYDPDTAIMLIHFTNHSIIGL